MHYYHNSTVYKSNAKFLMHVIDDPCGQYRVSTPTLYEADPVDWPDTASIRCSIVRFGDSQKGNVLLTGKPCDGPGTATNRESTNTAPRPGSESDLQS